MFTLGLLLALASAAAAAPTSSSSSVASSSSSSPVAVANSSYVSSLGYNDETWIAALEKAKSIVSQLTLEEKLNYSSTPDTTFGACSGHTNPIERFGIPAFCFADGPTGANSRYASQFPAEVTTGATWDRSLFKKRAEVFGQEYADIGVHVPLSIVAGPFGRTPWGGRNWENWGQDPFLSGVATSLTVEGFQSKGVTGLIKHFFLNEQEYLRIGEPGGYMNAKENQTLNVAEVDAATAREMYVAPFVEGIRAGAGGIMCSYNKINGTLACSNDEVLNKLLKEELNFGGFVVTDWNAAYDTLDTALNGTDYTESTGLFGDLLAPFIASGTVSESLLDDKVTRMLTSYFALGQDKLPDVDFNRYVAKKSTRALIREVAESSITLLKNVRGYSSTRGLPLNNLTDLLLVGSPAAPAPYGIVNNEASGLFYTTGREYPGFITDGFGSGGSPAPYAIDPFNAVSARGWEEERPVVTDGYFSDNATEGFAGIPGIPDYNVTYIDYKLDYASTVVVFVSATAQEGYDRLSLELANGGDELIKYVASRHSDVAIVVTAPGPVDMSKWIDHTNVTAVLFAYFPTVEGGPAIASVLFGDVNPSGKLPFTIAQNVSDYNSAAYYNKTIGIDPTTNLAEGSLIDYRWFDAKKITPLYEFGFGLSYTTFSFSDLKIASNRKSNPALVRETNEKFFVNGKETVGLYDYVHTIKATVKNTGSVVGAEVAQLYLSYPDSTPRKMPVRQLRGFDKQILEPGKSATVSFDLRNKDLAYYSTILGGWTIPSGDFTVTVGSSSRKLPLSGKITV